VIETKKLFSLFRTVFAVQKHLEALGSLTVFAILDYFDTEKTD